MKITHKKSVNASSVPNYGGAFDIDSSMFFTREDLDELNEKVVDHISETFSGHFDVSDSYIHGDRNEKVLVEIYWKEAECNFSAEAIIDMRKIRRPSDLANKYGLTLASDLIAQIKEYSEETGIEASSEVACTDELAEQYIRELEADGVDLSSEEDVIDALMNNWGFSLEDAQTSFTRIVECLSPIQSATDVQEICYQNTATGRIYDDDQMRRMFEFAQTIGKYDGSYEEWLAYKLESGNIIECASEEIYSSLFSRNKKKKATNPQEAMQQYLDKSAQLGDDLDKLQQKALAKYGKNVKASGNVYHSDNQRVDELSFLIRKAVRKYMKELGCKSELAFVVEGNIITIRVPGLNDLDALSDYIEEAVPVEYYDIASGHDAIVITVDIDVDTDIESATILPGPGDYDPPEGPEMQERDDYEEEIILELDADIVIDEEGNWDYVDDNCMWASASDKISADWYSEEYKGVYLVDHMGAVEKTDDLLMTLIPDTPGKHHISGEVHLFFTLSNIQSWTVDSGLDEDGDVWYEEEYDTDSIDTEFNYRKSYIKDFKFDSIVDR